MTDRSESSVGGEPPHDILAAEAFALGEADQALHREPPHDVLAADEFPLPSPEPHSVPPDATAPAGRAGGSPTGRWLLLGALGLALTGLRRRRARRRSS